MNETCTKAEQLLNSIFESAGFDVRASASESDLGCLLAISGSDSSLLLNEGGELLDALQQILNQALGRSLPKGQRIICDANDFRAAREAELRAMAENAARQVRATSSAFVFGPMEPGERRVIHLSLADEEDLITESVGEGNARRLRVSLKPLAGSYSSNYYVTSITCAVVFHTDTIVALSTPPGRSGIGVIRISGPDSLNILRVLVASDSFNPQPNLLNLRSLIDPSRGETLDQALVCFFKAPHSFTGEDLVESHCDGSRV